MLRKMRLWKLGFIAGLCVLSLCISISASVPGLAATREMLRGAAPNNSGKVVSSGNFSPQWEGLGFVGSSQPAVVRDPRPGVPAGNNLVFVRHTENYFWVASSINHWESWSRVAGPFSSGPTAVAWDYRKIAVFGLGTNHYLYYGRNENGKWTPGAWTFLGGPFVSDPVATSCKLGRMDVFAQFSDKNYWQRTYENGSWSKWNSIGSPPGVLYPSSLAVDSVSRTVGNCFIDVYGQAGANGSFVRKQFFNQAWFPSWFQVSQQSNLAFTPGAGAAAIQGTPGTGDTSTDFSLFARGGGDDAFWWIRPNIDTQWQVVPLSGGMSTGPAAIWMYPEGIDRIDVFALGTNHIVWRMYWDPSGWH